MLGGHGILGGQGPFHVLSVGGFEECFGYVMRNEVV
jgi:hypothetical protein